jgi:hypothetical protein
MDSTKKAELEKRMVLGLAGIFVVVLVMGPLKSLGLFRQHPATPPAASSNSVDASKSIPTMMREHYARMEPKPEVRAVAKPTGPREPAAYLAQELRDPMKSLLPEDPSVQRPVVRQLGVAQPPPPPPPPTLRVQGLLWGGREPQAIIDNAVYKVNDLVKGAKILEITRDGVTIEHLGTPVFYSPTGGEHGSMSRRAQQWR